MPALLFATAWLYARGLIARAAVLLWVDSKRRD